MKRPFLILTLLIVFFILINLTSFIDNIWFYASGSVLGFTIKNSWWFAILNIVLFLFLVFLVGRKNVDWKAQGAFSAFIISLFIEMYGIPLSLYVVANQLTGASDVPHQTIFAIDFFGINLAFDFWMTFGAFVILLGIIIILVGWYQLWTFENNIFKNLKQNGFKSSKKPLYTEGLYKISRHPQYIGFLYVVWGWMIAWPTLITLLMAPFLTYAYIHAAKKEEQFIAKENKAYLDYKTRTPFLI